MTADRSGRARRFGREAAGYAVVAAAVLLSWEVIKAPVVQRAPPALAVRLAGASPEVLQRAGEGELVAGREENARDLSAESLARAPFNARALRIRGLAEARLGSAERADEMLTLAGNWSLRDDPAHAWLVENRLRRGDFGSAFAHADTLARRRPDLYPSLFRLFTLSATQDRRALPALTRLLATRPPWRQAYLSHLQEQGSDGAVVMGTLAIALEQTPGAFNVSELQQLYDNWIVAGRLAGIRQLRDALGRPSPAETLQNGDFSVAVDRQLYPFGWRLAATPGITTSVIEDDLDAENLALRLEYDSFASGSFLDQFLLLTPGDYILTGDWRTETPRAAMRFEWRVVCAESGVPLTVETQPFSADDEAWRSFRIRFTVPAQGCSAQWLRLVPIPGDRRTRIAAWFDNVRIRAVRGETSAAQPVASRP